MADTYFSFKFFRLFFFSLKGLSSVNFKFRLQCGLVLAEDCFALLRAKDIKCVLNGEWKLEGEETRRQDKGFKEGQEVRGFVRAMRWDRVFTP